MSQRLLAVSFTLLMLVGSLPTSTATHTGPLVPDIQELPHARPEQRCFPVGIQEEILVRANQAQRQDPAFYRTDLGVPAVCVDGGPLPAWQQFILQADATLEHVRNASREVQRQVDLRLETTLPESNYPNELIEPRTVLLNDTFNGFRTSGFGDWAVVTERGEDPAFKVERFVDVNASRNVYRFGNEAGYEEGVHQWLVSPEIDLTALKGNKTAVQDLVQIRDDARTRLRFMCNEFALSRGPGTLAPFCGDDNFANELLPAGTRAVFDAYEAAFDQTIAELPVMQHGAFLELTYKFNLAPGEDGVRMWIYQGDRAPDRSVLFSNTLGFAGHNETCVHRSLDILPFAAYSPINTTVGADQEDTSLQPHDLTCSPSLAGGEVIRDLPGMQATATFNNAVDARNNTAFTGDMTLFRTARLNLTPWMEQRIWVLFEVKTRSNDRGLDTFNDTSRFPRAKEFGFQLARAYVEGDGYLRNFRLKDVAATYPYEIAGNQFGDSIQTRTTVPPGNAPIVSWVHNAGDHTENGTLKLTVSYREANANTGFATLATYTTPRLTLRPDEVKPVSVPWGAILPDTHSTLKEGYLYRVDAVLTPVTNGTGSLGDQVGAAGQRTPPIADPNATAVRPANAAGVVPGAGVTSLARDVRAATLRNITLLRADGALGNPILLCSSVALGTSQICKEHYAGPKGEPRNILVGVRNDGNTVQNITLDLTVELDGVAKPDTVLEGTQRLARDMLPGEVRPILWTVVATQPGAYRLVVSTTRDGETVSKDPNAERTLFVQRSTGLICLDTLETRECGSSFNGEIVPALRFEDITASAIAPDGSLYVATTLREAENGKASGQLAIRDPEGVWRIAANLSATRLNETDILQPPRGGYAYGSIRSIVLAPDGTTYLVGDNQTILRWNATSNVKRIPLNVTDDVPAVHLTSAIWYKGTLLAAGTNGTLAYLNNGTLEPFHVKNASATSNTPLTYPGTIRALAIAPDGNAVLVGDAGVLLRHTPSGAFATGWTQTSMDGKILAFALNNATLRTIGTHAGRLVVTGTLPDGAHSFILTSTGTTASTLYTFKSRLTPPPVALPQLFTAATSAHDGRLYVLDSQSRLMTCDACHTDLPSWSYVLPVRPSIVGKGAVHPAAATILLADASRTVLLGEAGMALDLRNEGQYNNMLDWTVVPALAAHDGGVLQTRRNNEGTAQALTSSVQNILFLPDEAGRRLAQEATQFRVFLNHSVNWTQSGKFGEVRAVYRNVPDIPVTEENSNNQGMQTCPAVRTDTTATLREVCMRDDVRVLLWNFSRPTQGDDWEFLAYPNLPRAGPVALDNNPTDTWFFGIEVHVEVGIRWAIDDLRVQGQVDGKWVDIQAWNGPSAPSNKGSWYVEDAFNVAREALPVYPLRGQDGALESNTVVATNEDENEWVETANAFDITTFSPWHVTTEYADRPVWAANNEFFKDGVSNPSNPRLLNNWDTRLVSPIIDLSEAYDPVIAWNHAFAFRTAATEKTLSNVLYDVVQAGDGGFVEVQYLRRGPECGVPDLRVTCGWSRFYPVEPDGGYPAREDVGYAGFRVVRPHSNVESIGGTSAVAMDNRIGENVSYWGRQSTPDVTDTITATRLTETYVPASVRLADTICSHSDLTRLAADPTLRYDCVPVNLTGRQVRVAFHLQTAGVWTRDATMTDFGFAAEDYPAEKAYNGSADSFPGEGWYITDFKVLGAKTLGIDLAATNLSLRVGYDATTIGVGPSTRVPINVTVENHGAFDALGYTGTLEIRRVIDRASKTTVPVETISLSQQPVLDAGKSTNHTIFWNVPAMEKVEYAISFTVTPIGIDRDEDHLDNTVQLATVARPLAAQTVRQYNLEFLVSPENATSDITRYVPMYINNTGNVPLEGFTVERRITTQGVSIPDDARTCQSWLQRLAEGRPSAIVDCRQWNTQRAAPAGTLSPLTLISDEVSPSSDLFWKAPERATYLISISAKTQVGTSILASATDKRITAFATYLFDDVEGGIRGDAKSGSWVAGPGWNSSQPGFRSTDAYAFGDSLTDRYPADANASFVTPTIDLGSARTARVAFYHNFAFEPGFDGGVIEASADDGRSWSVLTPINDKGKSASYNQSFPVQASSALHPTGNPEDKAYAFTERSSNLPGSVDNWVLTQLDLTKFANVSEKGVQYAAYDAGVLAGYSTRAPLQPNAGKNDYYVADWCPGALDDGGCWTFENLTQGTITAPTPKAPAEIANTFWWSGSASISDDGLRPIQNHLMRFDIDLSSVRADQQVIADWWEYNDRYNTKSYFFSTDSGSIPGPKEPDLYTFHTFFPATPGKAPGDNYRFNLGEPRIVETQGKWYHMRSDISSILPRMGDSRILTVGFAYTPVTANSSWLGNLETNADIDAGAGESLDGASNNTDSTGTKYHSRDTDDRGFAIDGFTVKAVRMVGGQPQANPTIIIDEEQASAQIFTDRANHIYECGVGSVYSATTPAQPSGNYGDELHNGWNSPSAQAIHPACMNNSVGWILRPPANSDPGRNWNLATELPGVNSSWRVVTVKDEAGYSPANPLPTGATPRAWYSGDLGCRDAETPIETLACPRPGSEARLITPAFDLGTISGDNAQLSFWHRYAFNQRALSSPIPLASGGAVEISVYNAQNDTWGEWKQIYSSPNMALGSGLLPRIDKFSGTRGGYTGVTADAVYASDGVHRFDAPFQDVLPPDHAYPVQYLYTGNSVAIETAATGAPSDGWIQEKFDVTDQLGKKVRFAFHYAYSPLYSAAQTATSLDAPDGTPTTTTLDDRTGWWVKDVAVVGDVLVGQPVQLRFRASTDGNVHEGHWLIDDVGVFGARYHNNVGLFVDRTPDRYGAYNSTQTAVPVTIRNLGDTVRRDLAVEVRVVGEGVTVTGSGPEGNFTTIDRTLVLKGFTLGPGQSATVNVIVHTPKDVSDHTVQLLLQLREANPQSVTDPFVAITDNEVQGLLTRIVNFTVQRNPLFLVTDLSIAQLTPRVGETVELDLVGINPGFGPVGLNMSCTARTITEYNDVDHSSTQTESPIVAAEYPCIVAGDLSLNAKEKGTFTMRTTPTKAGFLTFNVRYNLVGADANFTRSAGVPVGIPITSYRESFDRPEDIRNFTGSSPAMQWSYTRGHDAPGALLIGINETRTQANAEEYYGPGGCGGMVCFARTPPIDLHNYTAGTPAYLSFWHMDRFARHDGAQVRASVLLNEQRPNAASSWSEPCVLVPVTGYEGAISRKIAVVGDQPGQSTTPGDENVVFTHSGYASTSTVTPRDFFVTSGGLWEESWSLAVFKLPVMCDGVRTPGPGPLVPFTGRTVRIEFEVYPGELADGPMRRGHGQGWLIDDISISPLALEVRPAAPQRANLLDNTTKSFNLVLTNLGTLSDVVGLKFDALNSSAPEGSVIVPTERYTLTPKETRIVTVQVKLPRDPSLLPTEFKARVIAQSFLDPNAMGSTTLDLAFGPRQWPELALRVEAPSGIVQEATETFIPITIDNSGLVDSRATTLKIIDTWPGGRAETILDVPSMPSIAQAADEASRVLEFRWRPEKGSVGMHELTFIVDPDGLGEEYTRANNVAHISVPVSDLLIPDLHIAGFSALSMRNAIGGSVTPGLDADVARYEVTAGEVVSLELKVANRGRAGATNVDVRAFIGALSLPPKTVPYIAPGTEAIVTFNWLAQKGEHKIEFVVRSEQVEATTTNNRYPGIGVTLLTVKGFEIAVDIPAIDGILAPSSETLVPFRITNNGNAGEDLVLSATTPSGTRIMLPREGFFLRAGETYEDKARLILEAEAVAGEQFITINAVARENPMKVASGRAAMSVLASYGGSVAGGYAVGAPPELIIPVELVNEGNSLEPWKVTLRLPAGWVSKETMPASVVIPAHDRVTYQFHVTLPVDTAPGDRVMAVKAEMPNGEKREGVARVGVLALRSAAVTVEESAPKPDRGTLTLPVTIQNTGNVQQPFSVVLVNPPPGVEMHVEPAEFSIPPGGQATALLIVKPNATVEAGTYAISGYTRFEGVIPQTREGLANVQTLRVPIVRQDVRLAALEFTPRADIGAGDRVTVKATVQNRGHFAIENVPVHLFADDVFLGEGIVRSLAPGARMEITFNWTALQGIHTLTAVVDPYEDTVDADREDNAVAALASVGVNVPAGGIAAGRANAPGPGVFGLMAALAVAVLLTRGSGSWRRERR